MAFLIFNFLVHGFYITDDPWLPGHPVTAFVIANFVGMLISYRLSRQWTFKHRPPQHADGGRTAYDVQSVQPHLTLDGADPLPADERYGSAEPLPTAVRDTWAFDGATEGANTLAIALDLVLEKTSGPGPSTRQVQVQQEVDLGAG